MTLSEHELTDISGYKRRKDIVRWLNRNGIPYATRRDGSPSLTLRMYEESLLNKTTSPEPDFSAMV